MGNLGSQQNARPRRKAAGDSAEALSPAQFLASDDTQSQRWRNSTFAVEVAKNGLTQFRWWSSPHRETFAKTAYPNTDGVSSKCKTSKNKNRSAFQRGRKLLARPSPGSLGQLATRRPIWRRWRSSTVAFKGVSGSEIRDQEDSSCVWHRASPVRAL